SFVSQKPTYSLPASCGVRTKDWALRSCQAVFFDDTTFSATLTTGNRRGWPFESTDAVASSDILGLSLESKPVSGSRVSDSSPASPRAEPRKARASRLR